MIQIESEVWKPIEGFEGIYEVSNHGGVRSLDQIQRRSNGRVICDFLVKGRTLKPYRTGKGSGYLTVNLHGNGKDVNMKVHRLVATAFIQNPLNKPEVNHIDGNKKNNHVSNLEWATGAENVDHAYSNSLMKSGDESKSAKLTKEQVNYIRKVHVKGDSTFGAKPLAKRFGVSDVTIRNIVNGKKWTRINDC